MSVSEERLRKYEGYCKGWSEDLDIMEEVLQAGVGGVESTIKAMAKYFDETVSWLLKEFEAKAVECSELRLRIMDLEKDLGVIEANRLTDRDNYIRIEAENARLRTELEIDRCDSARSISDRDDLIDSLQKRVAELEARLACANGKRGK